MMEMVELVEITSELAPNPNTGNGENHFRVGPTLPWCKRWKSRPSSPPTPMVEMVKITSELAPHPLGPLVETGRGHVL